MSSGHAALPDEPLGIGQLRTIETLDGQNIVERLETIDDAKRFFRYTKIAGMLKSLVSTLLKTGLDSLKSRFGVAA